MAHSSSNKSRPMSIDAMLDMERKEVLALLENQSNPTTERVRSASPYAAPRSPVRSLLDIAEEPTTSTRTAPGTQAPVRSMLDVDSPPSSPPPVVRRSMLDVDAPPTTAKQSGTRTQPNSPTLPNASLATSSTVSRSKSDAGLKPVEFGPRALGGSRLGDPTSGYQFSHIYTANSGQQLPKRTSQPTKRQSVSAMAETLRNTDLSGLHFPGEGGRHGSSSSRFGNKSKSPHNRLSNRSRSPATFSPQLAPGKVMLGTGQIVDINNAYRRLSDANLAISSGSLAQLPMRKRSSEAGEGRLIKDYLGPDGEHLGSSDEDDDPFTSDDEDRGRNKAPRPISPDSTTESTADGKSPSQTYRSGRQTLSLLAAAEEERHHVASQQPKYQYKSLIPEPEIKVTNSSGDTVKPSKTKVHPNTSYDQGPGSSTPSVVDSDEEADMDDIKRAQKLSFSMTNILSAPGTHRAIRIIYRGDYAKIAQAAEEEHHRLRKYLVATDLSDESTHALEWAIGTVLRDGDTLIAIYCVDEDTGIVSGDAGLVPDDPKSMKEQAAALASVSSVSDFRRATAFALRGDSSTPGTPSGSPGPTGRGERSKGDEERHRAVKDITDRVLKLLRKTRLQVRVIVEVLHCKNPKHLITEVIDLINPTLVVIGSRGRSALKGVILGSFSNYLVTKSSVPVMVARKRLRKQSKYKRTAVRQVNNLSNPTARSLAMAKID